MLPVQSGYHVAGRPDQGRLPCRRPYRPGTRVRRSEDLRRALQSQSLSGLPRSMFLRFRHFGREPSQVPESKRLSTLSSDGDSATGEDEESLVRRRSDAAPFLAFRVSCARSGPSRPSPPGGCAEDSLPALTRRLERKRSWVGEEGGRPGWTWLTTADQVGVPPSSDRLRIRSQSAEKDVAGSRDRHAARDRGRDRRQSEEVRAATRTA
jgi:hypothetical protein